MLGTSIVGWLIAAGLTLAANVDECPGYKASNIIRSDSTLTANLVLRGKACNVYGKDITNLKLLVEYQTGKWSQQMCLPRTFQSI